MYAGEIVERAPVDELFATPQHPYTVGLLGSIPRLDRRADASRHHRGHGAEHGDAAARLPLRRALSVRQRRLPRRAAAAGRESSPATGRAASGRRWKGWCRDRAARSRRTWSSISSPRARCSAGRPRFVKAVDGVSFTRRGRQDAGAGRRIRLRQVHRQPAGAAADRADRRQRPLRGPRPARARRRRTARVPPRGADHLPGPLRLAQSAHDGRPDPGRAAGAARSRAAGAPPRARRGTAAPGRARAALRARAIRTNSPAASASASRSPGRWRSSRS